MDLSGSGAVTKVQTAVLVAIIVVAAVGGVFAYILLGGESQSGDTIKIGVCADLDGIFGPSVWQEVVLAVEQVNAEGGVLGRLFEVVAEDDDSEIPPGDVQVATNAMTKLLAVEEADYIITPGTGGFGPVYQELAYQHKKIIIDGFSGDVGLTQKVLDDYDRYKYYFRAGLPNITSAIEGNVDAIMTLAEYTGFSKVAIVSHDLPGIREGVSAATADFQDSGMDVVYTAFVPYDAVDFTSYFALAEAAGAEMLCTTTFAGPACIAFINEYADRQSPMVLWGAFTMGADSDFWVITEGKCEWVVAYAVPTTVGYPYTNKTLLFREAFIERWGELGATGGPFYDVVRYILPDAIRRAGTFETDAVISALETVDVETSIVRRFVFTTSHDVMVGAAGPNRPDEDYYLVLGFQWQNEKLVPVYPKQLMEEAGATYVYPDWPGPWD